MSEGVGQFPKGIDPALIHLTGTIVTWWGRIEGILVHDLITLRQLPVNAEIASKELFPIQTGRVIDQWARLQRRYYANDPARLRKLEEIKTELSETAEDRHVLVHFFWPYGATEGQETITLQAVRPRKGEHNVLEFLKQEISVELLDKVNERLVRLYHRVMVDSFNFLLKVNRERDRPANPGI